MGVEKSFNTAEQMEQNVEALLEAARYADMDDVMSLASSGVPLDSKDSEGRTVSKALSNPTDVGGRVAAKTNEQKKRKKIETSSTTLKETLNQLQDSSSKLVTPLLDHKDKGPTIAQDSLGRSSDKGHKGLLISQLDNLAVPASTASVKIGRDLAAQLLLPGDASMFSKYSLSEMTDQVFGHFAQAFIWIRAMGEKAEAQEKILSSTRQEALDAKKKAKEANDRANKLEEDLKKFREEAEDELKKAKAEANKLLKAKQKELDAANRRADSAKEDMYTAARMEILKKTKKFFDEL